MAPLFGDEQDRALPHIAANLRGDRERLVNWLANDVAAFDRIARDSASVRAQAHALVDDTSRQGTRRCRLEEALHRSRQRVHDQFSSVPTSSPKKLNYEVDVSEAPSLGRGVGRESMFGDSRWESWVRQSEQWADIEAADKTLRASVREWRATHAERHEVARRAIDKMDRTVRRAQDISATSFHNPPEAFGETFITTAALPMSAFLLIALIGLALAPVPVAGWAAIAVLVASVAYAVASAFKASPNGLSVTALAAGSSLALFTAIYLAIRLVDPSALQYSSSGNPISSIADTAFTSLTVGVTGGTIGIDLSGSAKVAAFVQILLTVGAIASGIAWGWRRLLKQLNAVDVPPEQERRDY